MEVKIRNGTYKYQRLHVFQRHTQVTITVLHSTPFNSNLLPINRNFFAQLFIMICNKSLVVALAIATGAQAIGTRTDIKSLAASSGELGSYIEALFEPENIESTWAEVSESIHYNLPGLTCDLSGPRVDNGTIPGAPIDLARVMEIELGAFYPNLHCTGDLDLDAIFANTLRPRGQARDDTLESIRTQDDKKVQAKKEDFIYSCSDAPHPGNCKVCIYSAAIHSVNDIATCVLAGYGAKKASVPPEIYVGTAINCGAGVVTDFYDRFNACFGRVCNHRNNSHTPSWHNR